MRIFSNIFYTNIYILVYPVCHFDDDSIRTIGRLNKFFGYPVDSKLNPISNNNKEMENVKSETETYGHGKVKRLIRH